MKVALTLTERLCGIAFGLLIVALLVLASSGTPWILCFALGWAIGFVTQLLFEKGKK